MKDSSPFKQTDIGNLSSSPTILHHLHMQALFHDWPRGRKLFLNAQAWHLFSSCHGLCHGGIQAWRLLDCLWAPSHSWKALEAEFRKRPGEVKMEPHLCSQPLASSYLETDTGCLMIMWGRRTGKFWSSSTILWVVIGLAVKVGAFWDCRTGTVFSFRSSLNTGCWKAHGCQVNVYWAKTHPQCSLIALVRRP